MPTGPWRAGVAVTWSLAPPAAFISIVSHGTRPRVFPPKPLRTDTRGQDRWYVGEQRAPGGVEIVRVLVMAQQNRVDAAQLRDR
jgi:hypothetical protein